MTDTFIIENSVAPAAIGDTLAAFPALHAYAWRADSSIEVWLSSAICRPLLKHHKIKQLEERPEKATVLDIQRIAGKHMNSGWSMGQGYMEAIGLPDVAAVKAPELSIEVGEQPETMQTFDVLIAPFSHSDNGTNTKIWPETKWRNLIAALKTRNVSIGLLGTKNDLAANEFWESMPVTPVTGLTLQQVCWLLLFSRVAITVDNGINWLVQAIKSTSHILLLPATANPGWTANRSGNAYNFPIAVESGDVIDVALARIGG